MTEVTIRNTELLTELNDIIDTFRSIPEYDDEAYRLHTGRGNAENGKLYTSEEHLREMLARDPDKHKGYPEDAYSFQIKPAAEKNPEAFEEFMVRTKYNLPMLLGAHSNALVSYYPPGGFVSWHTNWDAHAYQVLFTWSETGDGYFRYYDVQKDEIVHIPDVAGWQCRHYYFGRQDEPEHHCWHAAYTDCPRFTLAFKFANRGLNNPLNDATVQARDELIEQITLDIPMDF